MPRGRPKAKPKEEPTKPAEINSESISVEAKTLLYTDEVGNALLRELIDEVKGLRADIKQNSQLSHSTPPAKAGATIESLDDLLSGVPPEELYVTETKPEPAPNEPGQDAPKTLDLGSLDINSLLAIVNAADTTQQIAIVVDGAYQGEAWFDLKEREQFINAVRMRYVSLSKLSSGGGRIPAFEKKMLDHVNTLEEDKHEENEMRKWDEEERLRKEKEQAK